MHIHHVANAEFPSDESCVVRRTLSASPDVVFRAWTDPEFACQWSWGARHDTVSMEIEVRRGGMWKHHVRNRVNGENWFFVGVFEEVIQDRRLAHSFEWHNDKGVKHDASFVTIDFLPNGEHTDVVITHDRITTLTERDGTVGGWNDCLECIVAVLPSAALRR